MGEIKNPENSGVSDPSNSETPEEVIDNNDDTSGDNGTSDIDRSENNENSENDPSTELEEGEKVEEEVIEAIPEKDASALQNSETDSLGEADQVQTTIALYEKDAEGNPVALDSAKVQYTDGCASEDGQTVRKDSDITFRVIPNTGKKVKTVSYAVIDASAEFTKDTALTPASGDPYKIEKSKVAAEKVIAIVVETEDISFTLSATGGTLVKVETDATTSKQKLTNLTGNDLKFAYGEASSIALNVSGLTKDAKYEAEAAVAGGDPYDLGEGSQIVISADNSSTGAELVYRTYSLPATALNGVDDNVDQTVTITFTPVGTVTVDASAATVGDGYTVATQAVDANNDDQKDYVPYKPGANDTYDAGDEVVFAVAPITTGTANNYEVVENGVKVTLVNEDTDDEKSITPSVVTDTFITGDNTAEKEVYAAKIPADIAEGYTLKIDVTTKFKTGADTVTVKFELDEKDKDKVTIKGGTASANEEKEPNQEIKFLKGAAVTKYDIAVSVKDGYKLSKLEVKRTGKKDDNTAAPDLTADLIADDVKDGGAVYSKNGSIALREDIPAKEDGSEAAYSWIVDTVTVTIAVVPDDAGEKKTVTFTSKSGLGEYNDGIPCEIEVTEDETVEYDGSKTDGMATLAESAQYLSFRVKAETEPEVTAETKEVDGTAVTVEKLGAAGGYYSYQIPAKNFEDEGGIVTVTRATKDITAEITGGGYVDWEYESYGEQSGRLSNAGEATVDADETIVFTVDQEDYERPIASVTYKLGEDGAATPVAEGNGGVYEFAVKASDNITVSVLCETDERIRVNGSLIVPGATKQVDYDKEITARLEDKDGGIIDIVNAMVYDGTALADTKPTVADNVAKFTVSEKEQEQDLTVTLVKKKGEKVSFNIKSDKKVSGVSFTGLGEDKTVTLVADESVTLGVEAAEGNVNRLQIAFFTGTITDDSKVENSSTYISNDNVYADYDDGSLTITAKSNKTANANAGTIVLCRPDGGVIKDSAITVKTEAPFMTKEAVADYTKLGKVIGKHVTVEMTDAALQNVQSAMNKVSNLYSNPYYYYIKVDTSLIPAATAVPADYTGDDWKTDREAILNNLSAYTTTDGKKVTLGELIRNGGEKIQLIPDSVAPLALSFKVTVTPAQRLSSNEVVPGTAWTSDAFSTVAVNYSDTLNLGKNKVTLQTGRNEDIVVATPVFAGNNDRYEWVDVEIIDSTTGKPHNKAGKFTANWNAKDKVVTVNAKEATANDNNKKLYKNLAVKVTVYTEDSDYGVSAVKALGVESGISNVSLDLQKEIVYTGKKVTVGGTVTYNGGESENAPKKKAAVYSLANVGKALQGDKVTINAKNGKVTLAAGITLSEKEADNQFTVVAKANDYESNPREDSVTVTVVGEAEAFQEAALFEAGVDRDGSKDWSHASKVDITNVEVKETSGLYRVAALKIGAKANRDGSYNLYDYDNVAYDTGLLTFKSSNKNIAVDSWGDVEVKKVGKTNITVQVRSDKKKTATLKNVNFVVEKTPIVAVLTEYENSKFEDNTELADSIFAENGKYEAQGNSTGYYKLELKKETGVDRDGNKLYDEYFTLPNYSISFKNAKKAADKDLNTDNRVIYFTATGGGTDKNKTVVTITNKEKDQKLNKIVIDIVNAKKESAKNAPKVQMADKRQKIYAGVGANVGVSVIPAKKTDMIWSEEEDTYIVLSIDQSKAKDSDNINAMFSGYLDRPIALERVSDTEGRFSLNVFNNTAGSYSLVAALGTMKDGVFTQTHKDAALTLKVTKSNDKIKATTKYTLNPFGTSSKPFVVNGGSYDVTFADTSDWYTDVINAQGQVVDTVYTNYAKNMILSTGKANEFNRYFTITATEGNGDDVGYVAGSRIGIRKDLSQDEIATLLNKEAMKDNLTGYVSVTNGVRVVDLKVTVTVESEASKIKLSTKTTPTITGKVVTDIVVMNGKDTVDIDSYQITAKSGKKMEFASYYETVTKDAAEDVKKTELEAEQGRLSQGVIRVIAENASTGNHEFEVSVITKDMVDGKKFTKNEANQDVYNYAIAPKASGKIAVAEPKNAKNKVVFAKGDTNWKVESTDWQADKDETSAWYIWSTDRKFTFKNRLSGVAKIKVTTEDKYAGWFIVDPWDEGVYNESGEQNINLIVDKDGLKAAVEAPKSKLKYGKACKVKATFSYLDAEGNEITTLPKDTVTFNITLPNEPESQEASALTILLNAKRASLQNLADRKTKEYERVVYINNADRQKEEVKKAANAVAEILLNEVKRLANGTTAILKVVPDEKNTAEKYSYAVKVNDETVFTLVSRCDGYGSSALEDELVKIAAELAVTAPAKKKEVAGKYGLGYNPMTTADAFKGALIEALRNENVLTNSMAVSVSRDEEQTYAPTTEEDGYFTVNVKVIDKNIRRGEDADGVIADEELSYTFDSYTDAKDYKQNGANSIATTLNATEMAKLINETYEKVSDGIKEDNEFTDGMKTALKEAIKKYADEQIDNQYLTVKEVSEEGYDVEVNRSDWKISFVVSYEGEESFDVEASVTVAQSTFTGKQTVDALIAAVDAKDDIVLSSTTSAAALEEVKAEIKELSTNPNYNNSGKLEVSLDGDEKDAFLAPTKEEAGWINVKVDFAKGSEDAADSDKHEKKYTFMINKLPAEEGEDAPELTDTDKAKSAVQSSLTNTAINKAVKEAWIAAVGADVTEKSKFTNIDTRLLAKLKEAVKNLPDGIAVADSDGIVVASIALPEDTDKAGSYGKITVTLNDSDSTEVTIDGGALAGDVVYQDEEKFKTALVTEVNKYEIPYNSGWIEDGAVKDEGKTAILGAITSQAKALVPEVTENPLYLKDTYKDNISAVKKAAEGTTFTVNPNGSISVANVDLKFAADDSSPKTVSVKVLAETEMKTVASVKIDKVDNVTVAAGTTDGSDAEKAFPIESATAAKTVTFSATVTGANENLTADDKKVTWALKSATDGTSNFANVSNTKDGEKISIDPNTGVLTIPKEAYVAGADSIKAAVVATSVFDKATKDTFYVEIKLDETIDTVTITGSTDTIEAPKGSEDATEVTYTATLSGSHVKAETKVTWTNSGNNDETNVTIDDSVDNKATVKVAVGAKANTALKLTAAYGEGQTAKKAEKTITIVANDKIDTNTTIGFAADGTRAVWADGAADQNGTLTIQNQDTNDVLVPIAITSDRDLTAEKAVVTVTNAEGGAAPTGITVVDGTGKNRGKSVLKIANTALEIPAAKDAEGDDPAVPATVLKLTATLPAGAGQAAATEEFGFNIVIVKHITDVNVVVKNSEGTEIEKVNGVYTVNRGAADADITVDLTESKVIGAHVNSTTNHDDQKIKWVITSKNSASQSAIAPDGTLTIKEGGTKDYLIKVKAVSVAGSTAEKEISKTVTIKLVPAD